MQRSLVSQPDLVPFERERAVVRRVQHGDRRAAAQLYGWYGTTVFTRVIMPRLPVRELAEDVLKDTFVIVLQSIDSYEVRDRSIYFWIRRIAINQVLSFHRRAARWRRIRPTVPIEMVSAQAPPAPSRATEQREAATRVEAALAELNPRYASAIRLRLLEDLDRHECATALGVRVANFDLIYHRACKAFRRAYTP
jgi:RNA polymerase sigma factor (sigma-70 family)